MSSDMAVSNDTGARKLQTSAERIEAN
jgi:hypothetical protein